MNQLERVAAALVKRDKVIDALVEALEGFANMAMSYGWKEYPSIRGDLLGNAQKALAKAKEYQNDRD